MYIWESTVRDYELDGLGIVNNATYISYFEQCRNDYARSLGIDFIKLHQSGFDLVVAKLTVKYLRSLIAGDRYVVSAWVADISTKRIIFHQAIRLQNTQKIAAKAIVDVACVDRKTGQSQIPHTLIELITTATAEAV